MKAVSIIVPLWNGRAWIKDCLDSVRISIQQAQAAAEVLVVDNASTDEGAGWVATHAPHVKVIRNERNLGFAGGCNVGLRAATGDVLILLNQDVRVEPGWLAGLLKTFDEPGVGIAGSLALFPDGKTVQHAGGLIDWPLGVARHRGYGEPLSEQWQRPCPVPFVTGASLAMGRNVLESIGLLDEGFWPGYGEDVDFCLRAREKGYSVMYAPSSILIHAESSSFPDSLWTDWARLRGRLRLVLKHMPEERFLQEFVPAERAYQANVLAGDRNHQVGRAYWEALAMALEIGRIQAWPLDRLLHTLEALASLAPQPDMPDAPGLKARERLRPASPVLTPTPWERTPLVGPLIHRLRRSLHQLAIFYADRRQRELLSLAEELANRVEELEQELARLRQES